MTNFLNSFPGTPQAISNFVAPPAQMTRHAPRQQDPSRLAKMKQMQMRAKQLALQKELKEKIDNSDPVEIDKQAKAVFAAEKAAFERLENSGRATKIQEIEFLRLQRVEDARRRKFLEDKMREAEDNGMVYDPEQDSGCEESDDGMFVQDPAVQSALGKRSNDEGGNGGYDELSSSMSDDNDVYQGASSSKRRKPEHPRKAPRETQDPDDKPRPLLGARARAGKVTNFGDNQPAKRGRPKLGKAAPKQKKDPGSDSKPAKGGRTGRPRQKDLADIGSLYTGNVIADARGNELKRAQPTFTAKRKDEALKQLIASVPEEARDLAKVDKAYLLAATKDFTGRGAARSDGQGGWSVRGMKSSLKHYQLLGSAFMRRRETGEDMPQGGLCADQMGLGKTVMMLANIINGRALKGVELRTTLIVATPALVQQWYDEIQLHCDPRKIGNVMKYRGSKTLEAMNSDPLALLKRQNIIITTYGEVMRSYPKVEIPIEVQPEEKQAWWEAFYEENKGLLHQMKFLRVVLDEAQAIKNHKSATSRSCRQLDAKHRWALSGTPIQNTLSELYPYFKFLRVPHTGTFRVFKQNFIDGNSPDQLDRLMAFLKRFMIRRTHLDEMFGAPLLQLPKATEKREWLNFNDFEHGVYEIVHRRMVLRINNFARRDLLERNYSNILTMLLRLRQMTSHILMVEYAMRDLLECEDHEKLRELADYEAQKSRLPARSAQIAQLRASLKSVEDETLINKRPSRDGVSQIGESAADDQADNAGPHAAQSNRSSDSSSGPAKTSVGKHHGLNYEFQQYLRDLQRGKQWEELQRRTVCARCSDRPENPWYTTCYHVYCRDCLLELERDALMREAESRCIECGDLYFKSFPCEDLKIKEMATPSGDSSDSDRDMAYVKPKSKKSKSGTTKTKDWIDMAGVHVLPSAKTIAIKAQILNWVAENPKVKTIIYSQFIPMIRILSKMCQAEKWGHVMVSLLRFERFLRLDEHLTDFWCSITAR